VLAAAQAEFGYAEATVDTIPTRAELARARTGSISSPL
jgi:hypothetical protein